MTDAKRCGICRRSLFMERRDEGDMCSDCSELFIDFCGRVLPDYDTTPAVFAASWAAKRAWEFADAVTDATSFGHRPGDPGHSRTPSRARRRR